MQMKNTLFFFVLVSIGIEVILLTDVMRGINIYASFEKIFWFFIGMIVLFVGCVCMEFVKEPEIPKERTPEKMSTGQNYQQRARF